MKFKFIDFCIKQFDSDFYTKQYPDVSHDGQSALNHFIEYGFYEGRKPYAGYTQPTLDFSGINIEELTSLPIKIYIPTFNNPTFLKNFMDQIKEINWLKPVIYDNNSKSSKMLKTLKQYEDNKIKVIRRLDNLGPESIYTNTENFNQLPNYFLISDPDLDLNGTLNLNNIKDLIAISEFFRIGKVGHALNISKNKQTVKKLVHGSTLVSTFEWEQQFWRNKIGIMLNGDQLYSAPLGATLCLINKKFLSVNNHWSRGIRIAGKRAIKHIPWENPKFVPYFERKNYQRLQKYSFYTIPILRIRLLKTIKLLLHLLTYSRRR